MKLGNGNFVRKHNKDKNFTVIDNGLFKDKRLSLKAKGLMAMLLSFPENWEFSESGLTALSQDGRTSVRSGLVELEKTGYLLRERARNDKGVFTGTIYNLYEIPMLDYPLLENPTLDNEHNKELSNKELTKSSTKEYSTLARKEEMFNEFYKAYPRKVSKANAEKIYMDGKIDEETHKLIMQDMVNRKGSTDWEDVKYIKHPSTYLNAKAWNDEIIKSDKKGNVFSGSYDDESRYGLAGVKTSGEVRKLTKEEYEEANKELDF